MRHCLYLVGLLICLHYNVSCQLSSSNLPIVSINTLGKQIVDEPKIMAEMKIIDNGVGKINFVSDTPTAYNGLIGIEIRGAFSATFPQKSYGIETRDAIGNNVNVSIFGMPEENDWALLSTYNDKAYVRNTLANKLFAEMGNYGVKSKFCEVLINNEYRGIYQFSEKTKRDKNRVDIAKLSPSDISAIDVTGGYIIKIDYWNNSNSWLSAFHPIGYPSYGVHYVYEYPKPEDINQEQKNYIKSFFNKLESALYASNFDDPQMGYRAFLDTKSFIDYFLINELSRNNDGFKKSWFMHKDRESKGGKLKAGPVWDFDWAWTNINECYIFAAQDGSGWAYKINDCHPDVNSNGWYVRMMQDNSFKNELKTRWTELRKTIFDKAYLFNYIDSVATVLDAAQKRHESKWHTLGIDVGTPEIGAQPKSFPEDITLLKNWISKRIDWLDKNMPGEITTNIEYISESPKFYPNPSQGKIYFENNIRYEKNTKLIVQNIYGDRTGEYSAQEISENRYLSLDDCADGVYFIRIVKNGSDLVKPSKILLIR